MVRECKWRGSDELSIWMPWSQKRRFVWLCPNNRYSYLWVTKWRFLKCQRLSFVGLENKYTGIIVGSGAQISPIFLVFYPGVSVSSQYYFPPGSFWRSSPFLRIFNIFVLENVPIITGLLSPGSLYLQLPVNQVTWK